MSKKNDTILYLRQLYAENYTFSNFNLKDVIDFIDELETERTELLKKIDKTIEYIEQCFKYSDKDCQDYYMAESEMNKLLKILEVSDD